MEILHAFAMVSKDSIVFLAWAWNKQTKKKFSEYFFGPTFELGNIQCNKVKNIFGRFFLKSPGLFCFY